MLDDVTASAFEKAHDLLYVFVIFLLRYASYAAALAFAYMKVKTWAEFAVQDGLGGNLELAGAKWIDAVEKLHKVARVDHAAVRTEIAGAVLDHLPGQEDFRKVACPHAYPGIGLGVFQQDVVAWLELLYKIVFKEKGIGFGFYNGVLCVGYLGDHDSRLSGQAVRRDKILCDPLVKVLCLADIYDIPLGVVVTVDSGGMREE